MKENIENKWEETLRFQGSAGPALIEVYMNPETTSWTITISKPELPTCILGTGEWWIDRTPVKGHGI